jgi:hypothetical protein
LLLKISGTSLISKNKRTRILNKIALKTYPLDPGSEIRKKFISDPGGKKHRIPGPEHWCNHIIAINRKWADEKKLNTKKKFG